MPRAWHFVLLGLVAAALAAVCFALDCPILGTVFCAVVALDVVVAALWYASLAVILWQVLKHMFGEDPDRPK